VKDIKAAFFDRDGTLIKDVSYLSHVNQVEFLPRALALARFFARAGLLHLCGDKSVRRCQRFF